MPNYTIALGVRPPEVDDLSTAHAKRASLRSMLQRQENEAQEFEANKLKLDAAKRSDAEYESFKGLIARGASDEELMKASPGLFDKHAQARTARKTAEDQQLKLEAELRAAKFKRFADITGTIRDEDSYKLGIATAYQEKLIDDNQAREFLNTPWSPQTQALVAQFGQMTLSEAEKIKAQLDAAEEKRKAELHPSAVAKGKADATIAQQTAAGTKPIQPAEQAQINARLAEIAKANTPAELAYVASNPKASPEEREVAKAALKILQQHAVASRPVSTTSIAPNLSPEAIEMLARNVAAGGQMPALGRNAGGTIATVLNTAAAQDPNLNLAGSKADYKANSGSLAAQTKQADAVKAFEATALKNLDQFLAVSKDVVDTKSPWLNKPVRQITEKMVGSTNMTAFNVARQVAVVEIAKVLANPGLTGVLSDSARHEVQELIGPNATLKQIHTAAQILKTDMHNRRVAIDAQIAETRGRMNSTGAPAAPQLADPAGIR